MFLAASQDASRTEHKPIELRHDGEPRRIAQCVSGREPDPTDHESGKAGFSINAKEKAMVQSKASRAISAALKRLNSVRTELSFRQYSTIRGQIIAGDIRGAEKGLRSILPANFIKEEGL